MDQKYKQTQVWAWARSSWAGDAVRACRRCKREFWDWTLSSRLGESVRTCRSCRHEFWAWTRSEHADLRPSPVAARWDLPNVDQLAKSIAALHMRAPDAIGAEGDPEAPIFVLSTAKRSGSTLLQRILVTDPRVLLWGEPLGDMDLVPRIAQMVSHSITPSNLESSENLDPTSPSIATSWIADLYPPSENFRLALRGFFDRWLGEPAHQLGFVRWGLKEVRLGATEATLLRWLYPRAKFLVLSRHPYDCYRSAADLWRAVDHWPSENYVDSAAAFARLWNRLALSWAELPEGFPLFHIKYDDLIKGKVDFRGLESWLGIEIKENVALSAKVGGTAKRPRLSWFERLIIAREAGPGMHALGYPE